MIFGITGTPGTGKTSACKLLKKCIPYPVIPLNELIKKHQLYIGKDEERDSLIVDIDTLKLQISSILDVNKNIVIESHLSHYVSDIAIVLRTSPKELKKRLSLKRYSDAKIKENIEAEALDIILVEALELCNKVYEINTTNMTVEEVCNAIKEIIWNVHSPYLDEKYKYGLIDWSEEVF
ncbi:MAG TPA: adenylate kinase [Methanosarcinales archaeon]|nr:adenylate kinase [Methanosarcinales archaeon]